MCSHGKHHKYHLSFKVPSVKSHHFSLARLPAFPHTTVNANGQAGSSLSGLWVNREASNRGKGKKYQAITCKVSIIGPGGPPTALKPGKESGLASIGITHH